MDLFTALHTRRSLRRYTAQPIAPELIEHLLTAATWAPSAHNRQPWRFALVTDDSVKEALARAMGARLASDRLADGDSAHAVEADMTRSRARIVSAPLVIIACLTMAEMDKYSDTPRKKAEYLMAAQSVAMAVQNLLLAAHASGLGACWLCAPLFCPDVVRAALALPDDWEAQALITLGYPASGGKPAIRKRLDEVILTR